MAEQSTIFALSSGAGKAGIAVLRVSGSGAGAAADALTGGRRPSARSAVVRTLRHPLSGAELDQALVLWLPGPGSFTGEDCVEFHVHGGRAVVAAMIDALGRIDGLRLAEAGEFTRRAFFNGKLDLTEAEALADLVDADTEAQRSQALKAVTGDGLGAVAERWRSGIIRALALCEAAIDFSDEGDVADSAVAQAEEIARELHRDLRRVLDDGRWGEIIRDGFKVAIVGEPNVGKSSLLNALSRRDAAIVSDEPGTTRDVVEVTMDLGGMVVILADTAGLRETTGLVELEGIRRSIRTAEAADLVLLVTAAEGYGSTSSPELHRNLENLPVPILRVRNKIDAAPEGQYSSCIGISARTGEGIADLLAEIERLARSRGDVGEPPLITRARHRDHLALSARALEVFIAEEDRALELRAEDLRIASFALGRLTGRVDAEEVLGEIFGRFCIGK